MIISLTNQKGGVGKTTIAINMASYIASKDRRVLVVDADPQGRIMQWQSISAHNTFDLIHHPLDTLHTDINELSEGYEHIIIDAPPSNSDITLSALLISNLAIVPIEPSPLSIWASTEIVSLIEHAKKYNGQLEGRLLISRRVVGTVIGRGVREALESYGLALTQTEICQRSDFVKSLIQGLSVLRYAPSSEAAKEIRSLCDEINFDISYSKDFLTEIRGDIGEYKIRVKERRYHPRRVPLAVVDFVIQGRAYRGFIRNLSAGGAFVETRESFSVGQGIRMTFLSSKDQKPIKVTGEIVRTGPGGIAVKFEVEDQDTMTKSLVDHI